MVLSEFRRCPTIDIRRLPRALAWTQYGTYSLLGSLRATCQLNRVTSLVLNAVIAVSLIRLPIKLPWN
jgi:hypothetical protein